MEAGVLKDFHRRFRRLGVKEIIEGVRPENDASIFDRGTRPSPVACKPLFKRFTCKGRNVALRCNPDQFLDQVVHDRRAIEKIDEAGRDRRKLGPDMNQSKNVIVNGSKSAVMIMG